MPLLFILSYILIIYSFLRIKKSSKKLNILLWIIISIITYMGYNSIIIYLLSLVKIHSTLLLRSIINIFLSLIMIFTCKKKQEYYFDKKDLAVIIVLGYLTLIIFMVRFGFKFELEFKMDDPAVHFAYAKAFMTSNILDSSMSNIIYDIPKSPMFFSFTNAGTFLEVFKPLTSFLNLYRLFIIFELLSFFLSGVLLYFIVRQDKTSNKNYIFTIFLLILYELGYPLTNLLCGFHYWGLVILVISTILLTIKQLTINEMYDSKIMILILFILSISVSITYYLYVPVVYLSMGLYFVYLWKIKKKIQFKKLSIYFIITLIIPFIFCLLYYNIISQYFTSKTSTSMSIQGANYENLIGNFIFILPLIIYRIIKEIKSHKINIITILAIANFIYTIILFILYMRGTMSSYYYSKIYNLSWLIMYIYLIEAAYYEKELFVKTYILSYIVIVILACFKIENVIYKYNSSISSDVISNLADVYQSNMTLIVERRVITNDVCELLKNVYDNYDEYKNIRGEVPFLTTYFKKIWIAQILDIVPVNKYTKKSSSGFNINKLYINNKEEIEKDEGTLYFVLIDENNVGKNYIEDYDIVYQNNAGYVFKKRITE